MPCESRYCEPFVHRQVSGDSNEIVNWARVWNVEVDPGTLLTFLRPVGQAPTPKERLPGGCNSVVEYLLPKQKVVGSNPITRSVYRLVKGVGVNWLKANSVPIVAKTRPRIN